MIRSVNPPVPTGDATARYERLSHGGATWHDLMPTPANGTDGTIGAAFTWPLFNGESFVEIGTPAKLDFADAFTLCAWANMDIVTPPIQGNEAIIYKSDRAGTQNSILTIADTNGQVTGGIYAPGGQFVQSGAGFGGAWHYFVFVNEGAGNDLTLFIDGALINTSVGDGGAVTWGAVDWYFGRTSAVGGLATDDFFQGQIDTGRFYSRALSADEILRDYYAGKPAHP
jgi:hypothetical protein